MPRKRLSRALAAGLAFAAVLGPGARAAGPGELPPGPGRDLVYATCQTCHGLETLSESAGIGRDEWNSVLSSMQQYGLQVTAQNRTKILDYLATYLGPHPPPSSPAPAATTEPATANGKALFETECAACHQANGQGVAEYYPPLAGNHDLFLDRIFPVYVLLSGLSGEIIVEGKTFNGQMPSFSYLPDANVAALVNYVRDAWNNAGLQPKDMTPIDAATVARARTKAMSPAAVHAYRASLK